RSPPTLERLPRYVVRRRAVEQVQPVRLTATDILDTQTFPVSGLALDRVEDMVDTALAHFPSDGYVTSMSIDRTGDGVEIELALESPRTQAAARFDGKVHASLAHFPSDGYVTSMSIDRTGDGVEIELALESPRTAATARFT